MQTQIARGDSVPIAKHPLRHGRTKDKMLKLHDLPRVRSVARPPSIPKTCPVIQLCFGSSSHAIAAATSLGSPIRPKGCMATEAFRLDSFAISRAVRGVRTKPGATQLTLIPRSA